MEKLLYRVLSRLLRSFNIKLKSEPFISGDTFRGLADHIFERKLDAFNLDLINHNDIVFVSTHLLSHFFEFCHNKISSKYILISHNSDFNVLQNFETYIDDKIIKWYAQNNTLVNNKVVSIPIGLENLNYLNNGRISKFKTINKPYLNKIFVCFNINTNYKKRHYCMSVFKNYPNSYIVENRISNDAFSRCMKSMKFIASPEGNGLDCHRTWEAIYLNVVPVLLKNKFSSQFSDLPILLIEKWEDFLKLSENDLNKLYAEIMNKKSRDKAYFSYWKKLIFDNFPNATK